MLKKTKIFTLDDFGNVICNINVSLLDALSGCSKEVRTIYDTRNVFIPALSKNKDEICLDGCGVQQLNGKQKVIINIEYPENTDKLIKFLKKEYN